MRRDRKQIQKKKKRLQAQVRARARSSNRTMEAWLALARRSPFGPAFMTASWESDDVPPALVSVLITRELPDGTYAAQLLLIDRTCSGVKNALVNPCSRSELAALVEQIDEGAGPVDEVDVEIARSVVFAALEYAERLGFEPHEDFDEDLLGPRHHISNPPHSRAGRDPITSSVLTTTFRTSSRH